MNFHRTRIEDVLKKPRSVISKVNYHRYLTNRKEPVETISEMSPSHITVSKQEKMDSARQRRGIRKFAAKLRLRNKT